MIRFTIPAFAIAVLSAQLVLSLMLTRNEYLPSPRPLSQFPTEFGAWVAMGDETLRPEVLDILRPDDSLSREYRLADGSAALNLFMAYYKTQHRAKNAHDPKVCLPGSGWDPLVSKGAMIDIPELDTSVPISYYLVAKGTDKALVLYWYQTYKRPFSREQSARLQKVIDTALENRTDVSLIRLVLPVSGSDEGTAAKLGMDFIRLAYPEIRKQFPPKTETNRSE